MTLKNFDQNLFDLLSDAHRWEYTQINDNKESQAKKRPRLFFTPFQWILLVISIICTFLCPGGISQDFAGYIIGGMSLFVGLLFTLAVSLFDKFNSVDFSQYKYEVNAELYPFGARLKNYFKKTIILTLYTAIIAIVCILLLSVVYMSKTLQSDTGLSDIWQNICSYEWLSLIGNILIVTYRIVVFYLLFNFVYITKQMITSFYDYMIGEIDKIKLK